MNIEELRVYCLSKKEAAEDFPFDETTLVFKVFGKMFALTGLDGPLTVNLKCDPERAIELREQHMEITPGYHMNKQHWNTVNLEGDLKASLINELIDHSYDLVVSKLPKALKQKIRRIKIH